MYACPVLPQLTVLPQLVCPTVATSGAHGVQPHCAAINLIIIRSRLSPISGVASMYLVLPMFYWGNDLAFTQWSVHVVLGMCWRLINEAVIFVSHMHSACAIQMYSQYGRLGLEMTLLHVLGNMLRGGLWHRSSHNAEYGFHES